MGVGGAISFSGVDATVAGISAKIFVTMTVGTPCVGGVPLPTVTFSFAIPPIDTSLNVKVNGFSMTVENDGFGDLDIVGNLDLSNKECNPKGGFVVPVSATISNVTCNGINVAIPDVAVDVSPLVPDELMAMQTPQTNVILFW